MKAGNVAAWGAVCEEAICGAGQFTAHVRLSTAAKAIAVGAA